MIQYYLGPVRLAVLERWLPNTVTSLDRFHCTYMQMYMCAFQNILKIHTQNSTQTIAHTEYVYTA